MLSHLTRNTSSDLQSNSNSEALTAVLTYTDAMTLTVTVLDEVFANLKKHFSEREVVEITATIAAYNCVSRFLVALDVGRGMRRRGLWRVERSEW